MQTPNRIIDLRTIAHEIIAMTDDELVDLLASGALGTPEEVLAAAEAAIEESEATTAQIVQENLQAPANVNNINNVNNNAPDTVAGTLDAFGINPLPTYLPSAQATPGNTALITPGASFNNPPTVQQILQMASPRARAHIEMATHYGTLPNAAIMAALPLFPENERSFPVDVQRALKNQRSLWLNRYGPGSDVAQGRAVLYMGRAFGFTYPVIRIMARFRQSDSTLRGNWRTMTQRAEDRVRAPQWTETDVSSSPCFLL
ncbi:hypothetical protein BGZ63DRAFT_102856 [Mariannaea sp. PMI_226]|nr:hypothetical protein BGZ63DRAFT_102856 [Mariannaea sp. PMI_226]